jgi:ABC-2 type transport system ATP-binding protein
VPPAVLEVDRVAKRYGSVVACQDVSFEVRPGELFGLAGSPGAGKTTAVRMVLGVVTPDSGTVRLGGEPVDRRRIGYLPQRRGLYPRMRVLDQLVYLGELHGSDINQAHKAAEYWIARLGLRRRRADQVQKLGPGDQQRVQLATALLSDPDVLVLDEPFAGLETEHGDLVGALLRERADAGLPVLFTSDRLDLLEKLCDRVGIIHNGRMLTVGSVAELRAGSRTELVVDAPNAPAWWAESLPGTEVLEVREGRTRLALDVGVDDQVVLAAALATGPVRGFTRVHPTLAELYRGVVSLP